MVREILLDVSEMAIRAAGHKKNSQDTVNVVITARTNSPSQSGSLACNASITLNGTTTNLPLQINPIAGPQVYRDAASAVCRLAKVPALTQTRFDATTEAILERVLDGKAETLEKESQRVSALLDQSLVDVAAHEEAALILGSLLLKPAAGFFQDSRHETARLAAHLILASALSPQTRSPIGQIARVLLQLAQGRQQAALDDLKAMPTGSAAVETWKNLLRTYTTGDYRLMSNLGGRTPLEQTVWFQAYANNVGLSEALDLLPEGKVRELPDWQRVARYVGESVQIGHMLSDEITSRENAEAQSLYELYWGKPALPGRWSDNLNETPEHCVQPNGKVRVIGWGHWAYFLQRQICRSIQGDYHFFKKTYGVPEEASEIAKRIQQHGSSLRLQPFVMLLMAQEDHPVTNNFLRSVREVQQRPHLTPPACWGLINTLGVFRGSSRDTSRVIPARNQWFSESPLPGTTWTPSISYPSRSVWRPAHAGSNVTPLHHIAPFSVDLIAEYLSHTYTNQPPPEVARNLWEPLGGYCLTAMHRLAALDSDKSEAFESPVDLTGTGHHSGSHTPCAVSLILRYSSHVGQDLRPFHLGMCGTPAPA